MSSELQLSKELRKRNQAWTLFQDLIDNCKPLEDVEVLIEDASRIINKKMNFMCIRLDQAIVVEMEITYQKGRPLLVNSHDPKATMDTPHNLGGSVMYSRRPNQGSIPTHSIFILLFLFAIFRTQIHVCSHTHIPNHLSNG